MPDSAHYSWDRTALRFRNSVGKFVANESVKSAVSSYADAMAERIRGETAKLNGGTIKLDTYRRNVQGLIKQSATASAIVAVGGVDRFDQTARDRAQREVKFQYGHFNDLLKEVKAGTLSGDALASRAAVYAGTATRSYEAVRRQINGTAYREEKRVLSASNHCGPCVSHAARGWVDVGTLPEIGDECDCLSNCRCSFTYRMRLKDESAPADGVIPEEGPNQLPGETPEGIPLNPKGPILPGRPIAERLAAYTDGDRKVDELIGLQTGQRQARQNLIDARFREKTLEQQTIDEKDPAKKRILYNQFREAQSEHNIARDKFDEAVRSQRSELHRILKVDDPQKFSHDTGPVKDKLMLDKIDDFKDFISPIVASGDKKSIRTVWRENKGIGASYDESRNLIEVLGDHNTRHYAHEFGHHIEYKMNGATKSVVEFLNYRTEGEPLVQLSTMFPEHKNYIRGRKDKFDQYFEPAHAWYVGRDDYKGYSTEVVSMSLEALYSDPGAFAARDPELCKFLLGILDGKLR